MPLVLLFHCRVGGGGSRARVCGLPQRLAVGRQTKCQGQQKRCKRSDRRFHVSNVSLRVSFSTIESWSTNREPVPRRVIRNVRASADSFFRRGVYGVFSGFVCGEGERTHHYQAGQVGLFFRWIKAATLPAQFACLTSTFLAALPKAAFR